MTHYKHEAKQAAHDKMKRMGLDKEHSAKKHFDDVHPYDGVPQLSTDTPSGLAPISKQRFKHGGKVAHLEGNRAKQNLGKASRSKAPIPYERDEELKSGGVAAFNPLLRKKRAAAMAMRKKREGLPYGAPAAPGPFMPSGIIAPHKKGGAVHRHEDEAEDRKLIRKEVKPSALKHRAHKNDGGGLRSERTQYEKARRNSVDQGMDLGTDSQHTQDTLTKAVRNFENTAKETGYSNLKRGGRAHKAGGGRLDEVRQMVANPLKKRALADDIRRVTLMAASPEERKKFIQQNKPENKVNQSLTSSELKNGGRAHRATGGKVGSGKGKTSINIIIAPEGQKGASQMPAGGPPVIPPQLLAAMAGGAGGPPPGGGAGGPPPGAMPPGAGMAGAGGGLGAGPAMNVGRPGMTAPTPPMRKDGGRVGGKAPQAAMPTHQEHDYGSGSGLGRLEKRKWPLAK